MNLFRNNRRRIQSLSKYHCSYGMCNLRSLSHISLTTLVTCSCSVSRKDLKILKTSQLKYVTDEDLTLLGMSRPEQRRLKKFFTKYYPQNYLSRIKRLLGPGKKDEPSGWLGALSEERAPELLTEAPDSRASGAPNKHIIPAESITINKELGVGEFGVVQQGVWTNDGHRVKQTHFLYMEKPHLCIVLISFQFASKDAPFTGRSLNYS